MGLLVRLLALEIISPFMVLYLPLFFLFLCATILSGVVGLAIDLIVIAADQARRQRQHIELAASAAQLGLGWACKQYAGLLLQGMRGAEQVLNGVGDMLQPLAFDLMQRQPLLAQILSPALYLSGQVSRAAEDVYTFVHDEIVPVALDMCERFPLVEELLLRHAYNSSADET
ncbi:hypothetical protein DUNSADRAFT_16051 [Dunaliella salina]|uniref:Uncharacterized protein n=1 Tax=Dunaliella salina TaxID=3046 RepID=A0ABQ7G4B4_DUNSA|nr:hypothetical protein DUNSADRAFT_16051 [Dunaliella salina]|eukprot:KAF5829454.1 hypothetical protein DUNSADRAFT_16051 [Dunaliella salina]